MTIEEVAKEIEQLFAPLVIKPHLECTDLIPLDERCIISKPRDICSRVDAGK